MRLIIIRVLFCKKFPKDHIEFADKLFLKQIFTNKQKLAIEN